MLDKLESAMFVVCWNDKHVVYSRYVEKIKKISNRDKLEESGMSERLKSAMFVVC